MVLSYHPPGEEGAGSSRSHAAPTGRALYAFARCRASLLRSRSASLRHVATTQNTSGEATMPVTLCCQADESSTTTNRATAADSHGYRFTACPTPTQCSTASAKFSRTSPMPRCCQTWTHGAADHAHVAPLLHLGSSDDRDSGEHHLASMGSGAGDE